MDLKFVEATQDGQDATRLRNYGKFTVGRFTSEEWARPVHLPGVAAGDGHRPLLPSLGWGPDHVWIADLQTGEGAMFRPGGYATADLDKHRIWVCPLFQPFLEWLYDQVRADPAGWWDALPPLVELPGAPFEFHGHRRPGPDAGPVVTGQPWNADGGLS